MGSTKLKIYNSLTKGFEVFTSIAEKQNSANKEVTFYSCGPTVYDFAHIGNFRSFLNADLLRRTLELLDYKVIQVMNLTDVGHMTEDDNADGGGVDKMEAAGQRLLEDKKSGKLPEGVNLDPTDPYQIAGYYSEAFINDAKTLGLRIVDDYDKNNKWMPKATAYVPAMIEFLKGLEQKGYAYVAKDGVLYFDIQQYKKYGELSGNTIDSIQSGKGGRVSDDTQSVKKHPADFMLWKPDSKHLMRWDSPWGEGYPGWHIECSVMADELIGKMNQGVIDFHSGGEDNIFPHHECEIAQSCSLSGQSNFANYWFHTRFLKIEGEKMSKSKGNFFTLKQLIDDGHSPAAIRLELLRMHYRNQANFTFEGVKNCQRMVERFMTFKTHLANKNVSLKNRSAKDNSSENKGPLNINDYIQKTYDKFKACLADDLNVSGALGVLNEAMNQCEFKANANISSDAIQYFDKLLQSLGLLTVSYEQHKKVDDTLIVEIENLLVKRKQARADKNWAESDKIRDALAALNVQVNDGAKEGEKAWRFI